MAKRIPIPEPSIIEEHKYDWRKSRSKEAKLDKLYEKQKKLKEEIHEARVEFIKANGFVLMSVPRKRRVKGEIIFDEIGYRTWVEDFVDEDTGEVVSIDRYEAVYKNGKWFI